MRIFVACGDTDLQLPPVRQKLVKVQAYCLIRTISLCRTRTGSGAADVEMLKGPSFPIHA